MGLKLSCKGMHWVCWSIQQAMKKIMNLTTPVVALTLLTKHSISVSYISLHSILIFSWVSNRHVWPLVSNLRFCAPFEVFFLLNFPKQLVLSSGKSVSQEFGIWRLGFHQHQRNQVVEATKKSNPSTNLNR